ncbi:type VI secretion system tube protein Hcp [Dyadobacter sp. LHD-138]|uniref:type VI secretion system tube protein Hcp n=1 Tax=Dyadobacter sp. LHD-138 TaxID=3071413 RepID=UPI0027E053BB|nr:type VI secretion system tube protein Hcp [Dyadobacter sp. LHD-138]MDQ6480678.1 type VI secretion system tube protein Hcp [Dyadobacter sp. LHD-138]
MKKLLLPFVTLVFCLVAQHISAQKVFLKADPLTTNGNADAAFRDYVVITSRQLGGTAETIISGGPPRVGKPVFQNLIITKNSDILSNKLWTLMAKGTRIEDMEIVSTGLAPNGQSRVVTNKIELKDVFVAGIASSAAQGDCEAGCNGIAESYELVYTAIKITTYTLSNQGKWVADPSPFMYNIETGKSEF